MLFLVKNKIIGLTILAWTMVFLLMLTACGAENNAATTVQAPSSTAEAPSTTAAQPQAAETTTLPAAHTEEIEDAVIDKEFAGLTVSGGDGLPPVATAAGFTISQSEYRYMLNFYKSSLLLNAGFDAGADEETYFWTRISSNGKTRMEEARERVLSELHQLKICLAIARNRGIELEQDELENISTDLRAQIDRFGSRDEFEKVLTKEYGIGIDGYWKIDEAIILRDKLLASERESIVIPEDEIKDYYEQNLDIFGDMVRLRKILFLMEGADIKTERTAEETKKLAEETLSALNDGADMDALIAEISEEPYAADGDGERSVTRADPFMPEEILEWAFNAGEGDISIIEASYGYYIVRLDEHITRTYEDSRSAIEDILKDDRLAELIDGWQKDPANALTVDVAVLESIS